MSKAEKPSVFKSLLDRRKQIEAEPELVEELEETLPIAQVESDEVKEPPLQPEVEKRGPGRPRGRRSNPDYTQISAYIPLDLLLDIQDELAKEKRRLRKRSSMTVSELAENLLRDWLEHRKSS